MLKIISLTIYLFASLSLGGCEIRAEAQSLTRKANIALVDPSSSSVASIKQDDPEHCKDPDLNLIATTVSVQLCSGDIATGLLDLSLLKPEHIKQGVNIAGVSGEVSPSPSACIQDGQSNCVVDGGTYIAAAMTQVLPQHIKNGVTIAGVSGNVVPAPVVCAADGATNCTVDGTLYKAAKLSNFVNADFRSGVTIAGVAGSINSCGDGDSGCTVLGPSFKSAASADVIASNIKHTVVLGGVTGSHAPLCTADGGGACLVNGTTYKAVDMTQVINSNIKTGVTIAGVTGNVVPRPADCSTDGGTTCVTTSSFKAGDANALIPGNIKDGETIGGVLGTYASIGEMIDPWDIRIGVTVGDTVGALKVDCRNASNLGLFDRESNGTVGLWDSIDDFNNGGAFPTAQPAGWEHYFCGAEVWEDVSRTSGGVASTCATGDCIYRDKITGTMWSKKQDPALWSPAVEACKDLAHGGYRDWRLPTLKEMMMAYVHGIRSIQGANFFTATGVMNFWSATSHSNPVNPWAHVIIPLIGQQADGIKGTNSNPFFCVR